LDLSPARDDKHSKISGRSQCGFFDFAFRNSCTEQAEVRAIMGTHVEGLASSSRSSRESSLRKTSETSDLSLRKTSDLILAGPTEESCNQEHKALCLVSLNKISVQVVIDFTFF
jgi:hypothetical protein